MRNPITHLFRKTRGFFESFKAVVPKQERADWTRFDFKQYSETFDQMFMEHTDIKAQVMTIAGVATAEGVFVKPAGDYDRAKEAVKKIEDFNKRVRLKKKIYDTIIRIVKYGTCLWEKDFNSVQGLDVQLVPHQKYMAPQWTEQGQVSRWEYRYHNVPKHSWAPEQICVFAMPPIQNPPFGTALLTGVDTELDIKTNILTNMNAYMEKQAFASNVLGVGDKDFRPTDSEVQAIESKVRNREVGEDFVTSYPTSLDVMGAAKIETRMIPEALTFVQERIQDAMLIPTISKIWNSTEASAKVMTDWCHAVIINPVQELIAHVIEEQVYWPYLEDQGFSLRVVPELDFEPPDKAFYELMQQVNVVDLVSAGVVSRKALAEKIGFGEEYERDDMDNWEPPQTQLAGDEDEEKSWKVTELKRRKDE